MLAARQDPKGAGARLDGVSSSEFAVDPKNR